MCEMRSKWMKCRNWLWLSVSPAEIERKRSVRFILVHTHLRIRSQIIITNLSWAKHRMCNIDCIVVHSYQTNCLFTICAHLMRPNDGFVYPFLTTKVLTLIPVLELDKIVLIDMQIAFIANIAVSIHTHTAHSPCSNTVHFNKSNANFSE